MSNSCGRDANAMTMDWAQYLALARELADGVGEAHHRSAISRAYYAALGATRDWLRDNQHFHVHQRVGDTHEQVWSAIKRDDPVLKLGKGSNRLREQICKRGNKLKRRRVLADYQSTYPGDLRSDTQLSINDAEQVFKHLQALSTRLP